MLLNARQIDATSLNAFIQAASSGASFSGNLVAYIVGANGYLGSNVVYASGVDQTISGVKVFDQSPRVPYSGNTGAAPSRKYVDDSILFQSGFSVAGYVSRSQGDDLISGYKTFTGAVSVADPVAARDAVNLRYLTGVTGSLGSASSAALSGAILSTSGALDTKISARSIVTVSGSSSVLAAAFSGIGGTLVIYDNGQILISGGAGGGGGSSTVQVTGSSAIATPNFTGKGNVTVSYDGIYICVSGSGSSSVDTALSGYLESFFVNRTASQSISGVKTFVSNPQAPAPTLPSGVVNYSTLLTVSGVLQTGINGAGGSTTNNYSFTGITGNFVNMAFWFDQYNLATGLNSIEAFVGRSFLFTGYSVGVINTGTQGMFSGSFYQRNQINTKTSFLNFGLVAGTIFTGAGGYNQTVSGLNRVGLDIFLLGTGITGLSIGLFGVGS